MVRTFRFVTLGVPFPPFAAVHIPDRFSVMDEGKRAQEEVTAEVAGGTAP